MGIRLLDGRPFRDDDTIAKNPVVIVDQSFADRYFPGRSVVGQEIVGGTTPPPAGQPWARIVGVVARANLTGLEGRDGPPFVYVPINQTPMAGFSVLLRTSRPETDVIGAMRSQLRSIDPTCRSTRPARSPRASTTCSPRGGRSCGCWDFSPGWRWSSRPSAFTACSTTTSRNARGRLASAVPLAPPRGRSST